MHYVQTGEMSHQDAYLVEHLGKIGHLLVRLSMVRDLSCRSWVEVDKKGKFKDE